MSKRVWGWIALILAIAGVYTLAAGLTGAGPAASASGNPVADGAVVLVLAAAALIRWWTAR